MIDIFPRSDCLVSNIFNYFEISGYSIIAFVRRILKLIGSIRRLASLAVENILLPLSATDASL